MSVALVTLPANRYIFVSYYIAVCGLPVFPRHIFPFYLSNGKIFGEKFLNTKYVI